MTTDGATVAELLSPQGQAALRYAELGMYVFPCWWPHLGKCACKNPDCGSPAKHPLGPAVPNGLHDATTDPNLITSWWTEHPQANVAIALGPSNLFVLDIDGPDGATHLQQLEDTYQPLPATLTVDTGRPEGDGIHRYFRQTDPPIGNRKIGHPKLETRGDGGYVIAPPSIHVSGRAYSWRTANSYDVANPPGWLTTLTTRHTPTSTDLPAIDGTDSHATRRLTGAAGKVALAAEGERNDVLNWAAYTAGRLIAAGRLDETAARDILTVAAQRAGLSPTEIAATITSGIAAGRDDPDHDTGPDSALLQPLAVTVLQHDQDHGQASPTSSWSPVDGTDYIDGTWTPPQPSQLARDDGTALLYPGRINLLFGESEAGKGWVALHAIQQALARNDTVLYIDFEDYPDTIYARLKLLGLEPAQLAPDRFAYIRPDHGLDDPGRQALGNTVARLNPDLVVLDGITGAMSLHQLDTNASTDVDQFYSLLGEPLARHGAAVVFIDHVTKSSENRGKGPIGSQHKRARVSGASYEITSVLPIAPGRAGKLRIRIDKDRLGAVRAWHPTQAGEFHLDSTGPQTVATVRAPRSADGDPFRPTHAMAHVSQALEDAGDKGLTRRGVEDLGGYSKDTLHKALEALLDDGYAAREAGTRNALIHRHVRRFERPSDAPPVTTVPGTSPGVPDAPGTVLRPPAEGDVPSVPRRTKRGTGDTRESDRPNTTRQVPL